ncbi:MAG: PAS domain S-box protein [Proteobacteria bacterium]|nr:MAG: PAS domain S-box protein [Pseudomonadota bacterium]
METLRDSVEPYEIEYRLRRHDGEYRWHLGRAMPIKKSTGEVLMWIGTNTDIHDQKTQR